MINNNTYIPAGYKLSELGVIPEGWQVKQFKDICKVNQGLQIPIENRLTEQVENSYKYITIQYLNNGKNAEYVLNPSKSVICNTEDVLMTRTGNTGIVVSDVEGVFHNNFFKIEYQKSILNKWFLISYLRQKRTQHILLVKAGASTIPDLNHNDFYSIYIPIPPLEEQERIAEILGMWDRAIELQGRKVALLQSRKRALMQQLLTPHRRLPNFSTTWETVELGELLSYEQPTPYIVKSTEYDDKYSTPVLTAGKTFILGYTNETIGVFRKVPVIIFDDFTTASKFVNFPFKAKSSAMKILSAKAGIDINFVFGAMQHLKYVVGGHERHWISKFAYLTINIPSLGEQRAIAEVLTTADREIELATQNLTALRSQKRALMQQLLTGKKQVKI